MESKPVASTPRRAPVKKKKKSKAYTDANESLGMLRRCIRSVGPKVGRADPEQLTRLVKLTEELDEAIVAAVAGLRSDGFTWDSIGKALGTTRQAALMRFGPKIEGR